MFNIIYDELKETRTDNLLKIYPIDYINRW